MNIYSLQCGIYMAMCSTHICEHEYHLKSSVYTLVVRFYNPDVQKSKYSPSEIKRFDPAPTFFCFLQCRPTLH